MTKAHRAKLNRINQRMLRDAIRFTPIKETKNENSSNEEKSLEPKNGMHDNIVLDISERLEKGGL